MLLICFRLCHDVSFRQSYNNGQNVWLGRKIFFDGWMDMPITIGLGLYHRSFRLKKQCRKLLKKLLGANARHDCLRLDLGPVVEQYVVQARQALLAQHCSYIHHRLVTITTTNTTSTTINKTKQNKAMTSDCIGVTVDGVEYQEFSCLYPALGKFYMS